jgi:hypothetical protein
MNLTISLAVARQKVEGLGSQDKPSAMRERLCEVQKNAGAEAGCYGL